MQPDIATRGLFFGLLVGLLFAIYRMGAQHGRWSERRQQSIRRKIARQDQERFGITVIDRLHTRMIKKPPR